MAGFDVKASLAFDPSPSPNVEKTWGKLNLKASLTFDSDMEEIGDIASVQKCAKMHLDCLKKQGYSYFLYKFSMRMTGGWLRDFVITVTPGSCKLRLATSEDIMESQMWRHKRSFQEPAFSTRRSVLLPCLENMTEEDLVGGIMDFVCNEVISE